MTDTRKRSWLARAWRRFSANQATYLLLAGLAWAFPAPLYVRWFAFCGWMFGAVLCWRIDNEDIYADERKTKRHD